MFPPPYLYSYIKYLLGLNVLSGPRKSKAQFGTLGSLKSNSLYIYLHHTLRLKSSRNFIFKMDLSSDLIQINPRWCFSFLLFRTETRPRDNKEKASVLIAH